MNLLNRISHLFARDEQRFTVGGPQWQPQDYLPLTVGAFRGSGRSDSGVMVDEYSALTSSVVYACTAVIANTISALPVAVMRKTDATKELNHPVYQLLHTEPNQYMSAPVFRECMMLNLLLWGACYAFIEKDELGRPIALYPLRSATTRPTRQFGELQYMTQVGNTMSYLSPDQVFCVQNMSFDGISAISPIQQAKQAVGLSIGLEKYAAQFFGNGANLGGILTLPAGMKEEAIRNFVSSWKAQYAGVGNALKTAMLPAEYRYQQTTTTPENAQAIEARQFQILEVCRVFRVPPHLVQDLTRGTFSNIEFQSQDFATNTIQPWIIKWEAEANRKLFLESEKPSLEVRFDLNGLLRADLAARYGAYMQGRQGGWLTVNEIRSKEGLPAVEGGDELLRPLNMTPVGLPAPAPAVTPIVAPPPPKSDGDDAAPEDRALIEDAAKRVLTKESKALSRAAKKYQGKPDELRAWFEAWYLQHEPLVARTLAPSLKAAKLSTTPEAYAKAHVTESKRAIVAAIDSGAGVDDLTDEWAEIRPTEIANNLLLTK